MKNIKSGWFIKGIYNEACAAEGQCPFYFGRDKEGGCMYFMVIRILEGEVNGVDLSGVTVIYNGMITYSKYEDLVQNGEEVAIYISDTATPDQREVLDPFVSNGMGIYLIQKVFGIKYVKITIKEDDGSFHVKMPFGEMKTQLTKGQDGTPVRIENHVYPVLTNLRVCNSPFWRYADYGRSFDYTNRCATWADLVSQG
jgi:hypothetical protein